MAFGRDDCDAIYDRQIQPLLKSLNISPIRVDRREHKDDLNIYIIRMLKESDIALVDLTYARPSVYYEAGYAERKIPVVYTVRKDHLNRSQQNDSIRVHFDLEMKKIIAWKNPEDNTFSNRLKQRINYFIRPMKKKRNERKKLEKDRQLFMSRSPIDQMSEVKKIFQRRLRAKRFWFKALEDIHNYFANEIYPASGTIAFKIVGKTCYFCVLVVAYSIKKRQMEYIINRITSHFLVSNNQEIESYNEKYYLCSLKIVPDSRLLSAFPKAIPSESPHTFILDYGENKKYVKIISPINSSIQIKESAKKCLSDIPDEKTNRYTYLSTSYDSFFGRQKKISFK